ncbi:MAG: sporulation protein YqfD, partial [Oscillospiraceae bacterium]|nr:sporulation protein YqfD [Oscillospiraceae bacterium]
VNVPQMVDEATACNIVAKKSGLVTKVQTFSGRAAVLAGTTVEEGDLLISGITDTDTAGARILAGMGSVTARTWYTFTVPVSKETVFLTDDGEETHRFAAVAGRKRINFYRNNSSIEDIKYDTISSRMRWNLPVGLTLPFVWVRETRQSRLCMAGEIAPAEAQELGEAILLEYLHTQLSPEGTVISTLTSLREEKGIFYVTLSAECEEEIGRSEEILQNLEE